MRKKRETIAEVVDELAARAVPADVDRVTRQFGDKLARLQEEGKLPADVIDQLRVMWRMLQAPNSVVPWTAKAKIMAALTYFVSPLDFLPDLAGKAGYLDDAQVVRLVWRLVAEAETTYKTWARG